jgi:hypothetical protein
MRGFDALKNCSGFARPEKASRPVLGRMRKPSGTPLCKDVRAEFRRTQFPSSAAVNSCISMRNAAAIDHPNPVGVASIAAPLC